MELIKESVILCGGDRREIELYRIWRKLGVGIKLAGFEGADPPVESGAGADEDDFAAAGVLIAPLSGIRADGTVSAYGKNNRFLLASQMARCNPDLLLLAGSVAPPLDDLLAGQCRLVVTGEDEELALLNAIPTAEGAIHKAMELSPVTLHGSIALVIGLGRCGAALARALRGLGAHVRVLVRRRESAALAFSAGFTPYIIADADTALAESDFIFNTVPAPLLDASLLSKVKREALVLDLASAPGGTDFDAAASLGLQAVLLPALPGMAAPRTAGEILARVYPRLIAEAGKNTDAVKRRKNNIEPGR